jgi:hypothetical protein
MQFDELLLWLTNPRKGCTLWNKIITLTLIPFALILQPLGILWGSLYVIPWNKSSDFRKSFIKYYTIFITLIVCAFTYVKPYKFCTTVTPSGRLFWGTTKYTDFFFHDYILYFIWGLLVVLPLILFWNINDLPVILLGIAPLIGFIYGLYTDGKPSIWCYYTSYTSIVAIILLALYQLKIFNIIDDIPKNAISIYWK